METAQELYDFINRVASQPSVTRVYYIWRKDGFYFDGDREVWENLRGQWGPAAEFMEQVVQACPYFMRGDFFIDSSCNKMSVHVDKHEFFQGYWGLNYYGIKRLLEEAENFNTPWKPSEWPLNPTNDEFKERIEQVFVEAEAAMPAEMLKVWGIVRDAVAPMGFVLETPGDDKNGHSYEYSMRYLVPAA